MPAHHVARLGLIGVGKHGMRYARHIRDDFPGLELAAVSRRDAEKAAAAAREFGGRWYTDYRELIAQPGLDAVVVVVPPGLHLDIVTCAAHAGLPVLLEKPAAISLAVGEEMLRTVRAHPIPLMVAHTLRYNGVVNALLARRAEIGPIHSLCLTQRFEPSVLDWLDDPERSGGGMALLTGVHLFDLLRVLTGLDPCQVTCQMASVRTRRTEDSFAATVGFAGSSALAALSSARTTRGRTGHIELAGERGTLIGDHVLGDAWLAVGTRMESIAVGEPVQTVRNVLRDFVGALRGEHPVPIPLEEGLRAVALADACRRAAHNGALTPVRRVGES